MTRLIKYVLCLLMAILIGCSIPNRIGYTGVVSNIALVDENMARYSVTRIPLDRGTTTDLMQISFEAPRGTFDIGDTVTFKRK